MAPFPSPCSVGAAVRPVVSLGSSAFPGSRIWALGDAKDSASDSEECVSSAMASLVPAVPASGRARKFAPRGRGRPVAAPLGSSRWLCVGRRRRKAGRCLALSLDRGLLGPSPSVDDVAACDLGSPVADVGPSSPLQLGPLPLAPAALVGAGAAVGQTLVRARPVVGMGSLGPVGLEAPGLARDGPSGPPALSSFAAPPSFCGPGAAGRG